MSIIRAKYTYLSIKDIFFSHFWKIKKKRNSFHNSLQTISIKFMVPWYENTTTIFILKCKFMYWKSAQKMNLKFKMSFVTSLKNQYRKKFMYTWNSYQTIFHNFMPYYSRKQYKYEIQEYIHFCYWFFKQVRYDIFVTEFIFWGKFLRRRYTFKDMNCYCVHIPG